MFHAGQATPARILARSGEDPGGLHGTVVLILRLFAK